LRRIQVVRARHSSWRCCRKLALRFTSITAKMSVLSSRFVFKVGGQEYEMPTAASMWLPRDIPHVWANIGDSEGKLILACFPGGFEKFFDEVGSEMLTVAPGSSAANQRMKDVMAKYGMEWLGPPLFKPLAYQH
jgi:hypothetical protein